MLKTFSQFINEVLGFHGSARQFDKFDNSKILSGEGNVSFGHGIYVGEHPDTGKHYAMVAHEANKVRHVYEPENEKNILSAKLKSDMTAPRGKPRMSSQERSEALKKVSELDKQVATAKQSIGKYVYQVQIEPKVIPRFLHLDKPLHDQTPEVRQALGKLNVSDMKQTGINFYKGLEQQMGSSQKASAHLQSAGIHGTKYLDEKSRKNGTGTHNYVVFDANHVTIKGSKSLN